MACSYQLVLIRSESFPNGLISSYSCYYLSLVFFVWGVVE